jgi:hypothetical protein
VVKNITWDEIKSEVDDNGGVVTVSAWRLREAQGAGRLTVRINQQISDSLAARGLGHVPFNVEDMPTYQDEQVRIYDRTTALGKVIESAHHVGDDHDERLREAINEKAVAILEKVRDLVAE